MSNNLFDSVFTSNSVVEEFTKKPTRLINLNIEYFQKNFTLHMPDNETVYSLKELIAQEIGLPVSSQKLKVFRHFDFVCILLSILTFFKGLEKQRYQGY